MSFWDSAHKYVGKGDGDFSQHKQDTRAEIMLILIFKQY